MEDILKMFTIYWVCVCACALLWHILKQSNCACIYTSIAIPAIPKHIYKCSRAVEYWKMSNFDHYLFDSLIFLFFSLSLSLLQMERGTSEHWNWLCDEYKHQIKRKFIPERRHAHTQNWSLVETTFCMTNENTLRTTNKSLGIFDILHIAKGTFFVPGCHWPSAVRKIERGKNSISLT